MCTLPNNSWLWATEYQPVAEKWPTTIWFCLTVLHHRPFVWLVDWSFISFSIYTFFLISLEHCPKFKNCVILYLLEYPTQSSHSNPISVLYIKQILQWLSFCLYIRTENKNNKAAQCVWNFSSWNHVASYTSLNFKSKSSTPLPYNAMKKRYY